MNKFLVNMGLKRLVPTKTTKREDVFRLISMLRPVDCEPLIRFGNDEDGGYLIPDVLDGVEACFSPGVAGASYFEEDCARRGMDVFLADFSVDCAAIENKRFHFLKKYIGASSNNIFITLDDWVKETLPGSTSDLLLQIDIEGYEYEAFLSASNGLMKRFRVITGEFHLLDQLWSRSFFFLASRVFEKILETHTCVHLHPNSESAFLEKAGLVIPPLMEMTFVRNDYVLNKRYVSEFPHVLDRSNVKGRKDSALPECWYR